MGVMAAGGRVVVPAAAVALAGAAGVAARRRLAGVALKLGAPQYRVTVERAVVVPAGDGVSLVTDVYHPVGLDRGPAVLVRTPYGRRGVTGVPTIVLAKLLAERGFRVVAQDVRGRFESGGEFTPFVREAADGAVTAAWVVAQPWSDGKVGAWGPSYVGATGWAAARAPEVTVLVAMATSTRLGIPDPGGLRHLDTTVRWLASLDVMEPAGESWWARGRQLVTLRGSDTALEEALTHLPLATLAEEALGHPSPAWEAWMAHPDASDPYWQAADHRDARAWVATAHITGWWDLFVDEQLEDFAAAAPGTASLTVGPWHHLDPRVLLAGLREGIPWLDHHLRGGPPPERAPVRVHVGGGVGWRDLPTWPPASTPRRWQAGADGGLRRTNATTSEPTEARSFRYDPADPTPALGGRLLSLAAGSVDDADLEARPDVLIWTSERLTAGLEVIGRPELALDVGASRPAFDLFARLCDVDPSGTSRVLTDGVVRVAGADHVRVALSALGHRFGAGHRIRLVVCGGAFPRYDRNLGEPGMHAILAGDAAVEVAIRGALLTLPAT